MDRIDLLEKFKVNGVSDAEKFVDLIYELEPQKRQAIVNVICPDVSLSLSELQQSLYELHPPFKLLLNGTYAEVAQFPSAGIPAQSKSISQSVNKGYNAGIGIAHDRFGNILAPPYINRFISSLKPQNCNESTWSNVRNELLKYTSSLGANWYRRVARLRYLRDGCADDTLMNLMQKSLISDPIPCYGGTSALSLIFWLYGGSGCPVVFPSSYWGNMNLKCRLHGMQTEICNYMEADGTIRPEQLREKLSEIRNKGYSKVVVYFNFPHNPTGVVPNQEEAYALGQICREASRSNFCVIALSDEPYFPFLRGSDAIQVPFSYYLQPMDSINMITAVSINGTKRDGIYGFRHSDLFFQYPIETNVEAVKILEEDILQGMLRGLFSFSNVLNQYIVGRGLTQNALLPLMNPNDIELSEDVYEEEKSMVDTMKEEVCKTTSLLSGKEFDGFNRVGTENSAGGFFISHTVESGTPSDVHKVGLQNQCGVIAAGDYVRINALLPDAHRNQFIENLKTTLAVSKKIVESSNEE